MQTIQTKNSVPEIYRNRIYLNNQPILVENQQFTNDSELLLEKDSLQDSFQHTFYKKINQRKKIKRKAKLMKFSDLTPYDQYDDDEIIENKIQNSAQKIRVN